MLKKLSIKQFAIIDDISLDFYSGMTVLTGETGAGKSIIIDAISLLLGARADKTMIRNTAESSMVEGVFEIKHPMLKTLLDHYEIDYDDTISIQRILSRDNQNIIKINQQRASLKIVSDLANYLADIHSQFDTSQLIHPEHYIHLIDSFRKDKIKEYKDHYQNQLSLYLSAYDDYHQLKTQREQTLKQLDLYQFQLKELSDLDLEAGELERLSEQVNMLNNIDKINYNLAESFSILNDQGLLENLYLVQKNLDGIASTSKEFQDMAERISNAYYELKDINDLIEDKQESLDYDPRELESMNTRIHSLERIQKKYDKDINALLEMMTFLNERIQTIEHYDDFLEAKEKDLFKAHKDLVEAALQLSHLRQGVSEKITKDIIETLKTLEIKHADFKIVFDTLDLDDPFNRAIFKQDGIDQVDFLISTNKGEPLKSLSKTASGGEMSRVMLTFKTIFAKSQKIPTIIFDEIDTGISGYIAKKIGRKISETANFAQVIAITHIPQVVAEGLHHIAIRKSIEDDHTKIHVKYLTYDERVEEIAQMVSAEAITEAARDIARDLLIRN